MVTTPGSIQNSVIHGLKEGGVYVIEWNRPQKLNALSPEMYDGWIHALCVARDLPAAKVVVVTGKGSVFSAGQELKVPPELTDELPTVDIWIQKRVQVTHSLVQLMIDFPKPLIAAVNGPAIGFACTTLALYDIVFATSSSIFKTPFMELGLCVEGCSSVTFPRLFGKVLAYEMLILGKEKTAADLKGLLISDILPNNEALLSHSIKVAQKLAKIPQEALKESRAILHRVSKSDLVRANDLEMDLLIRRLQSEEFIQVASTFAQKLNKKKKPQERL